MNAVNAADLTRGADVWDAAAEARGHTGWSDALVYAYDQPVRIRAVGRAIDRLFPSGLRGRQVLDVGCGTGDFIAVSRGRDARVLGVDLSAAVLDRARRRFEADPAIELERGAIETLDARGRRFDLITSITVLQHIVDTASLDRALARLRAALADEGRMLLLELAPRTRGASGGPRPVVERSDREWREALDRAGLIVVAERPYPQTGLALLRGFARLLDWVTAHLRGGSAVSAAAAGAGPMPDRTGHATRSAPSTLKRIARGALTVTRAALLALAAPWDHLVRMPLPRRLRYYRLYVVAPR